MWLELGTLVLSSLLNFAGLGIPQLNMEAVNAAPISACDTQTADACLNSEACDVFIAASGAEVCGVACDMRDANSCQSDGQCMVVDGACDYADYSPVGC